MPEPHDGSQPLPRRVELMLLLSSAAPDGVPLRELVDISGRSDRNAQASTMNMLLRLRKRDLIEYAPRSDGAANRGRLYKITRPGMEWLQQVTGTAPAVRQPEIETGAMRGERPTIVIRDALHASGHRPTQPCWVFSLARHIQRLGTA